MHLYVTKTDISFSVADLYKYFGVVFVFGTYVLLVSIHSQVNNFMFNKCNN